MKPAANWDEEFILHSLPVGESDWFEAKGRRGLDQTDPRVKESEVLKNLSKMCVCAP